MTRKCMTILVIGQICLDVAVAFSLWMGSVWQTKVTDLLLSQGLM